MDNNPSIDFCLELACSAKEVLVEEEGIGSDVAPCVFAFDEYGQCLGWAQMNESALNSEDQYHRLAAVAAMMRSGWHAHGLALLTEGYLMVYEEDSDEDASLAQLFASGDKNVLECLSVVYGDANGSVAACTLPYRQELGRKIKWLYGQTKRVEDDADGSFVMLLDQLFEHVHCTPWPDDASPSLYMMAIAAKMTDVGFTMVCGIPGTETAWNEGFDPR
jgi:hypothetical protein